MDISYKDKKLEKYANDNRLAVKKLGQRMAKVFNFRLNNLRNCETLKDAENLPGAYHELVGNRKGQWACDLEFPYKLVFEPQEDPIPTNENGQYLWIEIKGIEIIEIVDYH